jgi:hypothetical protein
MVSTKNPIYQSATFLAAGVINATAASTSSRTKGATSCMDCVRSSAAAGESDVIAYVWCSGAWNYSYTLLPHGTAYPSDVGDGYTFSDTGGAAAIDVAATANTGDLGSCCYTSANATILYGYAANATTGDTTIFNKFTCPARFTNTWITGTGTFGFSAADWWCSDGTFNHAPTTTSLGAASDFASTAPLVNLPTLDRRFELLFAACR